MTPNRTRKGVLAALAIGLLLPSILHADEERGAPAAVDGHARAAKTWSRRCQRCHAAPDAAHDTDRAFLSQIMETT